MIFCTRVELFLKIVIAILICVNGSLADSPKFSDTMTRLKAVRDKLLKDYDKDIRPTKEGSNTTEVITSLWPEQIIEVDEERALFALDSIFVMMWDDPRLQWDKSEYFGELQFEVDQLWKPDITVHNSHTLQVNPTADVTLLVLEGGTVFWVPPILTRTTCPALLEATYPDQVVKCVITFGSWVHDGWEVDFQHGTQMEMGDFLNTHPRWELVLSETTFVRNVTYFDGYDRGPYISLNAIFALKRRTPPEIATTHSACVVVMLLTLSMFWLPTNSSKKVVLGAILFLVLTVLLVYVAWSTRLPIAAVYAACTLGAPKFIVETFLFIYVGWSTRLLIAAVYDASFLQSTMHILTITLLLQIFVVFNVSGIKGPSRPPPALMDILRGPLGIYACLRAPFGDDDLPLDRMQLKEDSPSCSASPTPEEDWSLVATALDRLLCVVMSIAMVAIHHL